MLKAKEFDMSIKKDIMMAVTSLCNCPFNSNNAIFSGEFSCQPSSCDSDGGCGTSPNTLSHVTYRAAINGTSSILTADQILGYIEEWRSNRGTLLYNDMFRLKVFSKEECNLKIHSFDDEEC